MIRPRRGRGAGRVSSAPKSQKRKAARHDRWARVLGVMLVLAVGVGLGLAVGFAWLQSGAPAKIAPSARAVILAAPAAPVFPVVPVAPAPSVRVGLGGDATPPAEPVRSVPPAKNKAAEGGIAESEALPAPPKPPVVGAAALWRKNAVPFALPPGGPMVVLIIDDLGMDRKRTARVIGLPGPLTLAFLPYSGDLPRQTRAARAGGHELLIHVPMEPMAAAEDPGPGALLAGLGPAEIMRRFLHDLTVFDGYVGINNHMGSRFTSDEEALTPVLMETQRRGLLFVDSVTSPHTVATLVATRLGMPHARRDVFLDDENTTAAVRSNLARLESLARRYGAAVAIGHPHDTTIDAVAAWLPTLRSRGLILAPISALVRSREAGRAFPEPVAAPVLQGGAIAPPFNGKGQNHG